MYLYHDSQSPLFRDPIGPAPCGAEVTFQLRTDSHFRSAFLRFYDGTEKWLPMERVHE